MNREAAFGDDISCQVYEGAHNKLEEFVHLPNSGPLVSNTVMGVSQV